MAAIVSNCQKDVSYKVYALKYEEAVNYSALDWVVGANPKDSILNCNMFWFLKGNNGRNVLVDCGYIKTTRTGTKKYIRPDSVLQRINIDPSDITDVIITHPHSDHIGGIVLFPKAIFWMQEDDYNYFVGKAWQQDGQRRAFEKDDVRNLVEINLQDRLKLIKGDNLEIIPGIKVFTGSKHTFENQYVLVNPDSESNKILIADDAIWFYYNINHMLPANLSIDPKSYVDAMKRMKTLVSNPDFIIPGHDDLLFSKFPQVADWVVQIGN